MFWENWVRELNIACVCIMGPGASRLSVSCLCCLIYSENCCPCTLLGQQPPVNYRALAFLRSYIYIEREREKPKLWRPSVSFSGLRWHCRLFQPWDSIMKTTHIWRLLTWWIVSPPDGSRNFSWNPITLVRGIRLFPRTLKTYSCPNVLYVMHKISLLLHVWRFNMWPKGSA